MSDEPRRVAVVTGSARPWGLGREVALGLARRGYDIAVVDLRKDWGEDAIETIEGDTASRAKYYHVDVSSRSDVEKMVSGTVSDFGSLDVLVNNAAVIVNEPIIDFTDEQFDRQMNINFRGTALCSQAALRVMSEQGHGNIVNISSMGIAQPPRGIATYVASKAAVAGFSKVLAIEAARYNVIVSTVAPGVMLTAMGSETGPTEEAAERGARHQLLKRPMHPSEVADVVIYAATTTSPALTGQILYAAGGSYFG